MRIDTETSESLRVLAPSKSWSGASTDNGRQAPADVPDPAAGRETVARRLAAIVEGAASRAEELRWKRVIETAPVGLIIINDVGEVLSANQSALELFGVEQPELFIGTGLDTCVAAKDSKALADLVLRVCGGEAGSLECQVVGIDGKHRVGNV